MTNLPSPAALVTAALSALIAAAGLLALQILLGLEYTDGGSLGTRWSMIGAMVTLALLPVFLAIALRHRARLIAGAIGISFGAFLAYSLPATSGRTGEIKEAKASVADDVALWKSEHAENAKQLRWAVPDKTAECAGAPHPLPPNGWPNCRRKTGTVTALEERQAKLEAQITAAGAAGVTGDLGSTLWAWALSWLGVTAGAIRKGTVIAFAVGLDFGIWSLVALGEHLLSLAMRIVRANRAQAATQPATGATVASEPRLPTASETAQTSFHADDLAATRATVLGTPHSVLPFARRNGRNRDNGRNSGNGGNPGNRPRRPKPDNPGNAGPYTGRVFSRTEAERDIVTMLASGATVASQDDLAARWSVDKGTVSRWLKHMREQGLVPAAQRVGRCHRLVAAE